MNGSPGFVLDISPLQVEGYAERGIGRYVAGYAAALARAGRLTAALLAPELPPAAGLPAQLVVDDLVRWDSMAMVRELATSGRPAAYHVTAPFLHCEPAAGAGLGVAAHWSASGVPRVATVYDLIPLRHPDLYLPTAEAEARYRQRAEWVGASDLILAISEYTRGEVLELLGCDPARVVTVGVGVSPFFSPPDGTDTELWVHHFPTLASRPFVLTVSGSDSRKGTERLVEALARLPEELADLALVVAGDLTPGWQTRVRASAAAAGLTEERLILAGPVSDELLRAAYRRAAVSVMPSIAEGSGLPVLESAACGTAALASSTTSLGDTAASALAVFDPADVDDMCACLASALTDDSRREAILAAQRARAAESTWDAVALAAGAALDRLGGGRARSAWRPRPVPPRVALVGPVPPFGGGIGEYNGHLLVALGGAADVEAVVASGLEMDVPQGVALTTVDAFLSDARPSSYDAVVYTLGNSEGHLATVEAALRHPGWLWLHEVRLPAIAVTALAGKDDRDFEAMMRRIVARAYPGRAPLAAAHRAGRSNLDLVNSGIGLVAPLAERCCGLLVNSEVAARLLLLDLPPLAAAPPIHVLPPACPPVSPVREPGRRTAGSEDLVVAFGVVSMAKRPDLLVDAAALAGCRLAFVGPCPPILEELILDRAGKRAMADRVAVTGPVDRPRWREWMAEATLAVQLRSSASGETSAAVLEALAAGVPVLTNMASCAEWPDGTVSVVRSDEAPVVGAAIRELLDSPGSREALARSGLGFAADHQFEHLARALLSVVAGPIVAARSAPVVAAGAPVVVAGGSVVAAGGPVAGPG